jgi:hypothetical protein
VVSRKSAHWESYLPYGRQWIYTRNFQSSWQILVKFDKGNIHRAALIKYELREIQLGENHTLIKQVKKFPPHFLHPSSDLGKIRYRVRPQKQIEFLRVLWNLRHFTQRSTRISLRTSHTYVVRDSSVGKATRYVMDGPGIESRWGEISRTRPDQPRMPPSFLHNGYRVIRGGKAAGAWRWSPSPIYFPLCLRGLLCGDIPSPIILFGWSLVQAICAWSWLACQFSGHVSGKTVLTYVMG